MLRLAGAMAMCLARELEIEDLKNHSRELVNGHTFVKHPGQPYYPCISPATGKVLLIAACIPRKFIAGR
jgi:hypothetical protein